MSKTFKITISISSALIVILLFIGAWLWYGYSQTYVKMGFAQDKFPYRLFSMQEMAKMYPQEPLEGVATIQTPEQTHTKFIAELKRGNIDGAVECCVLKSSQEKMLAKLIGIKDRDLFMIMLKDLSNADFSEDKKLEENSRINIEFYGIEDGKKIGALMTFQKNLQGVWLIESF